MPRGRMQDRAFQARGSQTWRHVGEVKGSIIGGARSTDETSRMSLGPEWIGVISSLCINNYRHFLGWTL